MLGPLAGIETPPPSIAAYDRLHPLDLHTFPGPEAQIAALADDIAYNNHDLDDGLRAGLFAVADLAEVPLVGPVFAEVGGRYPGIEDGRLIHEAIRRVIDRMVRDLIGETGQRLKASGVDGADAVRRARRAGRGVLGRDAQPRPGAEALPVRADVPSPRVNRMASKARRVVRELFQLFLAEPQCLPAEWAAPPEASEAERARIVADYLAGMTDRFALDEHRRLFDTYAPV